MKYNAYVNILPKEEILDPQGKATLGGLHHLGFATIENVRVGKQVRLTLEAPDARAAQVLAEEAANKLLANLIVESFTVEVSPAANA